MTKTCYICKEPARYRLVAKAGRAPTGETDQSMTLYACRAHFDDVYDRLDAELKRMDPRIFVDRVPDE